MLNITTITRQSLGKVVSYYTDGADDYYAKDGSDMQWQGEGAKRLGLEGSVEQSRFRELLNGQVDESTKMRRVARDDNSKERLGYDLTFSAPKGVSMQALIHGDQRIVQAHDRAVAAAVQEAERLAMARTTHRGKTHMEHTGNLTVATFRHETSRELDPELHSHAFVLNMTQRQDGQWRALTNDGIINSLSHLGNVYKAELAKSLEHEGFHLRYDTNGTFDLAHFSERQVSEFSARSRQIEAALAEKGLDRATATQAEKNQISLATRRDKEGEVDREQLRETWQARAKALDIDFNNLEWSGAGADGGRGDRSANSVPTRGIAEPTADYADKVVEFGIQHLTERQAIMTEKELMDRALKHGYGALGADDVRGAIDRKKENGHLIAERPLYAPAGREDAEAAGARTRREWVQSMEQTGRSRQEARRLVDDAIASGRLVQGEARFTTHIAQKRERDILKLEREGRGAITPSVPEKRVERFLARQKSLHHEQRDAVEQIASSSNRFMAVHGFAGTGKSYMTNAAKELLEQNGSHVTALAPYGAQVKALRDEGLEARTLQSFLRASDKKIGPNSVVFIDEAGVMPARQMQEAMQVIERHGARAVFLGDTSQTKAIEAGKPLDQMIAAGMQTSYMKEIQRQKDPELLKAVQAAAEGRTTQSLEHLPKVHSIKDADERHSTIVARYAAQTADERARSIVVTGTNDSRREINAGVREALGLEGQGFQYQMMHRLDTTQAERQHSRYYEKGAVVIPERDYKNGLQRGEHYRVLDTGPGNKLTVESMTNGEQLQFSPRRYKKLSVYSVEEGELSKGDEVKVIRNDAKRDMASTDRLTVKGVNKDEVLLEDRRGRLMKMSNDRPMPFGHAYATTIHGSQGLTADRIFANLDSQSRTTVKEVYYVAISRAKHEAQVFTDDHDKLPDAIKRETRKEAALEIKQLQGFAGVGKEQGREHGRQFGGGESDGHQYGGHGHQQNGQANQQRKEQQKQREHAGFER